MDKCLEHIYSIFFYSKKCDVKSNNSISIRIIFIFYQFSRPVHFAFQHASVVLVSSHITILLRSRLELVLDRKLLSFY